MKKESWVVKRGKRKGVIKYVRCSNGSNKSSITQIWVQIFINSVYDDHIIEKIVQEKMKRIFLRNYFLLETDNLF